MRARFISLLALAGCAGSPERSTEITQVEIAPLASEPSPPPSAAKQQGVRLPFSPETGSAVGFVGKKTSGHHNGSFERFSGNIDYVAEALERSRVRIDIDMASVTTDAVRLADHLRTSDFFFVESFTVATFESTSLKRVADGNWTHRVEGTLELRGKKQTISFPARITVTEEAVDASAELAINRRDFGIDYPGKTDDPIQDTVDVRLKVHAPFREH